jgi:hypothetical protein
MDEDTRSRGQWLTDSKSELSRVGWELVQDQSSEVRILSARPFSSVRSGDNPLYCQFASGLRVEMPCPAMHIMVSLHWVGARKTHHSLTRRAQTQTRAMRLFAVELYSRYSAVTQFNYCPDQGLDLGTPLTVLIRTALTILLKQSESLVCG